jgi:hypothetical protein
VIEIDGHDFHERTKEQAAADRKRDRVLSALGYTVIRFTGSEVYAAPSDCAREAVALALVLTGRADAFDAESQYAFSRGIKFGEERTLKALTEPSPPKALPPAPSTEQAAE